MLPPVLFALCGVEGVLDVIADARLAKAGLDAEFSDFDDQKEQIRLCKSNWDRAESGRRRMLALPFYEMAPMFCFSVTFDQIR